MGIVKTKWPPRPSGSIPLDSLYLMYNFLFLFPSGLCKWGWWVRVSQYVVHFDFSQCFTYLPCVRSPPDNKYLWPSRMKKRVSVYRRSVWLRGTGFRQAVIHLRKLEIEPGSVYLSQQAHVTPRVPNKLIYNMCILYIIMIYQCTVPTITIWYISSNELARTAYPCPSLATATRWLPADGRCFWR